MKKQKICLITGASRGIGKATAIKFAKEGFFVVINYKSSDDKAKEVLDEIESFGGRGALFKCDVCDFDASIKMVEKIESEIGAIDVFVCNAGIDIVKDFNEKTIEDWQKTFETNLFAPFILCKEISKRMFERKSGNIVLVSSDSAFIYNPFSADYDASKAGLNTLTKNLALNFSPYVRVNAILPGWVKTDMNKNLGENFEKEASQNICLRRFGEPEEIANCVYFLASEEASFVNATLFVVNGGVF